MKISNHAIRRAKERWYNHEDIISNIEKYWNTIRYSIRTEAFYIKAEKILIVFKNKNVITLFSRARWQAIKKIGTQSDSIAVPRWLRRKLLDHQLNDIPLQINDIRDFKKYHINIYPKTWNQ